MILYEQVLVSAHNSREPRNQSRIQDSIVSASGACSVPHLQAQHVVISLPGGILHIVDVDGGQPGEEAVAVAPA